MPRWLLLDYGQVLCTAPPADEWAALQRAAGYPPDAEGPERFHAVYWQHRVAYDRADLSVEDYWSLVSPDDKRDLAEIRSLDVRIWLHPHQPTLDAARRARERGWSLAIFSNAPVEVAAAIDSRDWLEPFEHRFYSCNLRAVKPEPGAYRQVLQGLGAEPQDVVFFDDRPDNVDGARRLGLDAHVFTDAAQIDRI